MMNWTQVPPLPLLPVLPPPLPSLPHPNIHPLPLRHPPPVNSPSPSQKMKGWSLKVTVYWRTRTPPPCATPKPSPPSHRTTTCPSLLPFPSDAARAKTPRRRPEPRQERTRRNGRSFPCTRRARIRTAMLSDRAKKTRKRKSPRNHRRMLWKNGPVRNQRLRRRRNGRTSSSTVAQVVKMKQKKRHEKNLLPDCRPTRNKQRQTWMSPWSLTKLISNKKNQKKKERKQLKRKRRRKKKKKKNHNCKQSTPCQNLNFQK
uniref:Uncharacterized protein n=1 Tax=Cacopsylla melanoneura TaxID=428564 RepID=A0A8D8YN96_9HEMI